MLDERTLPEFLEALGSKAPTPGGGAASALAGALAAALAEMVAQLTVGRPRFAEVDEQMRRTLEALRNIRARLMALMVDDERAYQTVRAAYQLPKATEEERAAREAAIQRALRDAILPPLRIVQCSLDALTLTRDVALLGNPTVASDAGCAAALADAAVRAGELNVLANVALLSDDLAAKNARETVGRFVLRSAKLLEEIMPLVWQRMGVEPARKIVGEGY